MKTLVTLLLPAALSIGGLSLNALAIAPGNYSTSPEPNLATPTTPAAVAQAGDLSKPGLDPAETPATMEAGVGGLRLDFKDAPLDRVLDYLSEAAGFVVIKEVNIRGTVSVVSHQPMTRAEAVDLLNSVLRKNGCAAIANDRFLTVVDLAGINTRSIPVKLWNGDPDSIPRVDTVVTMVLPVRFVAVNEMLQNIIPLVSPSTPILANQSGNCIIMTDTQANIHRIAALITAVDGGAEDITEVRLFSLRYANPEEIAEELTRLYADDSRGAGGSGMALPVTIGSPGRGVQAGTGVAGASQSRMTRRNRMVAVADSRTDSVVVTASRDAMPYIEQTVLALDEQAGPAKNLTLSFLPLENCEPTEAMQVLSDIFLKSSATGSRTGTGFDAALSNRASTTSGSSTTGSRSRTSGFGTGSTGRFGSGASMGTVNGGF